MSTSQGVACVLAGVAVLILTIIGLCYVPLMTGVLLAAGLLGGAYLLWKVDL